MKCLTLYTKTCRPTNRGGRLFLACLVTFLLWIETGSAFAKDYIVAVNGNDAWEGTYTKPFNSVQRAVDMAMAGDSVILKGGIYNILQPIRISGKKGSQGKPIIIRGEPGVVLKGGGEGVPGLWRGIVEVDDSAFIHVRGVRIENSGFFAFRVQNSERVTLEGNQTFRTLASGIYVRNSRYVWLTKNDVSRFCDAGSYGASSSVECQEGITLSGVQDFSVTYNDVHDAPQTPESGPGGGEGIDVKSGSENGVVAYNKVYGLNQLAIYIDGWARGVRNVYVFGNQIRATYMGIVVGSEAGGIVENVFILNNLISHVGVDGVLVSSVKANPGGDGLRRSVYIYNNTIHKSGVVESKPKFVSLWANGARIVDYGFGVRVQSANVDNIAIFNNIITDSATGSYSATEAARAKVSYVANMVWPKPLVTSGLAGEIYADPQFFDAAGLNFRVPVSSPASGRGSSIFVPKVDIFGRNRVPGRLDLGAFLPE